MPGPVPGEKMEKGRKRDLCVLDADDEPAEPDVSGAQPIEAALQRER